MSRKFVLDHHGPLWTSIPHTPRAVVGFFYSFQVTAAGHPSPAFLNVAGPEGISNGMKEPYAGRTARCKAGLTLRNVFDFNSQEVNDL